MEPRLVVNGQVLEIGEAGGHVTLLEWLRARGCTGSKEGCAEGECGACAVLVARDDENGRARWVALNACLVPAAAFDGQEIVTAEGLGAPGQLHPVQREMAERGGSQCGYCTPGFVCSMAAEYYRPGRQAVSQAVSPAPNGAAPDPIGPSGGSAAGAIRSGAPVTGASRSGGASGGTAPKMAAAGAAGNGVNGSAANRTSLDGTAPGLDGTVPGLDAHQMVGPNGFDLHALSGNLCRCTGYRPIRDAAYALGAPDPGDPLLARLAEPAPTPAVTMVPSRQGTYVRPASLADALGLLADRPDARVVAGCTDWGVELNIRHARAALTVGIDRLAELRGFSVSEHRIEIGAALSLSEAEDRLAGRLPLLDALFPLFASRLIRNGATLGGNLGTASPIGDAAPALLALDASLVLVSRTGEREVPLDGYFTGYRETVKCPDELIKTIRIPLPAAPVTAFHKIAKRRFDDISSVAVACALRLEDGPGGPVVGSIRIGLGGVAATPLRATAAENALTGRPWTRDAVAAAAEELARAGTPMSDHRASAAYRVAMLRSSLLKFHAGNPAPASASP